MLSLTVNVIVRAAYRWFVPAIRRAVKRFPILAAAAAVAGLAFGAWLACVCGKAANWPMTALGLFMLAGYSTFLGFVAAKWRDGTWAGFCDYIASVAE